MAIHTYNQQASASEMAAEIDRRGAVIERLEAERDTLRAALALKEAERISFAKLYAGEGHKAMVLAEEKSKAEAAALAAERTARIEAEERAAVSTWTTTATSPTDTEAGAGDIAPTLRDLYRDLAAVGDEEDAATVLAALAHIADLEQRLAEAERQRDDHFREIKRAQSIIDDMKAWRTTIYNASINADFVAALLSEHPNPASRSFVAVQIAEHCDRCIARATIAATERAEAAERERDAALASLAEKERRIGELTDAADFAETKLGHAMQFALGDADWRRRVDVARARLAALTPDAGEGK